MNNPWNTMTDTTKGIVLIATGTTLFVYTTGLIQKWLTLLVVAAAIALIVAGIMKADYHTKVYGWLKKH